MLEVWWRKGTRPIRLVGTQTGAATMENSIEVPQKIKIELLYDPTILLLGIYPNKAITQKDTCTPMFIASLLTTAKTWKQPKCPPVNE